MTTLPEGKHRQNPRVLITILITNAGNRKMQHGGPDYGICRQMLVF